MSALMKALTEEFTDIIDLNSDEEGVIDPLNLWSREDLVKIKMFIDLVIIEKKKEQDD